MLVLIQLMLMLMLMKTEGASEVVTVWAQFGDAVSLTSERLKSTMGGGGVDVRWTHLHLVLSLKNHWTSCHHGRCRLLSDGSLSFSAFQTDDTGRYNVMVFSPNGTCVLDMDFELSEAVTDSLSSERRRSNMLPTIILPSFVFAFVAAAVAAVVLRKKTSPTNSTGPAEENIYLPMRSCRGNHNNQEREKQNESCYVPCRPVVPLKRTDPQQTEAEDVYV